MGITMTSLSSVTGGSDVSTSRGSRFYREGVRQTLVLARGGSSNIQRNTLAAVQAALDDGADGVQLDVRVTADNQLVCCSGETTAACGCVDGSDDELIAELTFEQLQQRELATSFGQFTYDKPQPIPLLTTILSAFRARACFHLVLHAQSVDDNVMNQRAEWGTVLGETLKQLQLREQVVVTSFNLNALRNLHQINRSIPIGFNYQFDVEALLNEAADVWFDDGQEMNMAKFDVRDVNSGEGFTQWAIQNWGVCCDHRPHCKSQLNTLISIEKSHLQFDRVQALQDAGFAVGCNTIFTDDERSHAQDVAKMRLVNRHHVDWVETDNVPIYLANLSELSTTTSTSRNK